MSKLTNMQLYWPGREWTWLVLLHRFMLVTCTNENFRAFKRSKSLSPSWQTFLCAKVFPRDGGFCYECSAYHPFCTEDNESIHRRQESSWFEYCWWAAINSHRWKYHGVGLWLRTVPSFSHSFSWFSRFILSELTGCGLSRSFDDQIECALFHPPSRARAQDCDGATEMNCKWLFRKYNCNERLCEGTWFAQRMWIALEARVLRCVRTDGECVLWNLAVSAEIQKHVLDGYASTWPLNRFQTQTFSNLYKRWPVLFSVGKTVLVPGKLSPVNVRILTNWVAYLTQRTRKTHITGSLQNVFAGKQAQDLSW